MKKKLIILGGNQESFEGIKLLKKNYNIILIDGNKKCISRKICDYFVNANIYNTDDILKKLDIFFKKKNFLPNGALAIACDDVLSLSYINKIYKLKGINIKQANVTNNKILFKKLLLLNNIKCPKYFTASNYFEAKEKLETVNFKNVIIKPPDNRGARGVLMISRNELSKAFFDQSKMYTKKKDILFEEFIDGIQLSAEAIVYKGSVYLAGISDRNYKIFKITKPHMIEDGGETPSKFSNLHKKKIQIVLKKCTEALNFNFGSIKADIVIKNGKIYIIEVALRLSGGDYSTITIPEVYGNNIVKITADIITGKRFEPSLISLKPKKYQSNRFLFLKEGKIQNINKKNIKKIEDKKYVKKIILNISNKKKIEKITDHTKRNGTILILSSSASKAKTLSSSLIKQIQKNIKFYES